MAELLRTHRWLVPVLAASAVLLVLGTVWWQGRPGPPSDDPGMTGTASPGNEPSAGPSPGLVIASYYAYDETHLALNYVTGPAACYGRASEPVVEESRTAVTVTITRLPVSRDKDVVCRDIAQVRSTDITLSSPLGGRAVRDGSMDGAAVPPGSAPGDPEQAK